MFTGAGISGEAPASLPRGFALRDDLLRLVHGVAQGVSGPGGVADDRLAALIASSHKLEVVLGRLWGAIGPDALDCLLALHVDLPNEAHLLSAVHLARGGTHVTLNFDVGVETAYRLLVGHATLPADAPDEFTRLLRPWQSLVPARPAPMRVIALRDDFTRWAGDGRPPALLKPHGSLDARQSSLLDPVAVDIEELGQLHPDRHAAVTALGTFDRLAIIGYSGADPDVYRPLLTAAENTDAAWFCYSLAPDSPVHADAAHHGIRLRLGAPQGLAVTCLRRELDLEHAPAWPQLDVPGDDYRHRFDSWARRLVAAHPAERFAEAWAWLEADLGDLDTAERILRPLSEVDTARPSARLRHAEVLYTRARNDDRDRAAAMYRWLAASSDIDPGTRLHCRLRAGDIARGRAMRSAIRLRTLPALTRALTEPLLVIVATRNGRRQRESAADAYRALQQTGLRGLERIAAHSPRLASPVLATAATALIHVGLRAETLSENGNRRALVRQHRLMLTALAALLAHQRPPSALESELAQLHEAYVNADDLAGAANCSVTLALTLAASGDRAGAWSSMDAAGREYTAGRPDGRPLASGAALLEVTTQILRRHAR